MFLTENIVPPVNTYISIIASIMMILMITVIVLVARSCTLVDHFSSNAAVCLSTNYQFHVKNAYILSPGG